MVTGVGAEKQQTILELAQQNLGLVREAQSLLEEHFNRVPSSVSDKAEKPQNPNVLDEIIDEQRDCRGKLKSMLTFLSTEVIPKIH
ncbi:hypothetical protein LCGC14_0387930 [marine sediment metagenome]|uniref:Uncharacterized protein n=1 Tax=marine sediment metagenome TaxID=412755 RepID=A0A0F9VMN8_9ZZZZ